MLLLFFMCLLKTIPNILLQKILFVKLHKTTLNVPVTPECSL